MQFYVRDTTLKWKHAHIILNNKPLPRTNLLFLSVCSKNIRTPVTVFRTGNFYRNNYTKQWNPSLEINRFILGVFPDSEKFFDKSWLPGLLYKITMVITDSCRRIYLIESFPRYQCRKGSAFGVLHLFNIQNWYNQWTFSCRYYIVKGRTPNNSHNNTFTNEASGVKVKSQNHQYDNDLNNPLHLDPLFTWSQVPL